MDWQCTKCGAPITLGDGKSVFDATRRHSREAVHAWTGARRTHPNGTEQRWLTPSERADGSERTSTSCPRSVDLSGHSAAHPRRGSVKKTSPAGRWRPGSAASYLVAGLVITVGIVAFLVSSTEKPDPSPSGSPATLYTEPDVSPSQSYTASITEAEDSSTPTPPTPLDSSTPAYTLEPGNGPNTAGGQPRATRDNDNYYDDEWHRDYGNPDEYYDGNYDNDDNYHRKYGGS